MDAALNPAKNKILITRPLESAQNYAHAVSDNGFIPLVAPALEIRKTPHNTPNIDTYTALVFSSANAIQNWERPSDEHALSKILSKTVYTVGTRTTECARDAGLMTVENAGANAQDLVSYIASLPHQNILHVRGAHTAHPIAEHLITCGHTVQELITYEAHKTTLSISILNQIKSAHVQAVTLFSKRTAESFMDCIEDNDLSTCLNSIKFLCISDSVVQYVKSNPLGSFIGEIYAAETPDGDGILNLIKQHCTST